MLTLNAATAAALVISLVIPLVSSLFVKLHWPSEIAGLVTTVLSTADGFAAEWAHAGNGFDWRKAAGLSLLSLLVAFQARARIWLGSTIDAKALAVGSGVPRVDKFDALAQQVAALTAGLAPAAPVADPVPQPAPVAQPAPTPGV